MSKHDNIYNILGKLASLEPQAPKQENILKQLNESAVVAINPLSLKDRLAQKLAETKTVDEELLMPKEKKFAALAEPKDKITYADKIAGAKKDDKKKKDMDDESVNEGEYQDSPNKSDIPAFQRKAKAAPGDDSWKTSQQDLDDEASKRRNYQKGDVINFKDGDSTSMINYGYGITTLVSDKSRVYKGGSWDDRAYWLSPGTRRHLEEDQSTATIGFRCAMDRFGSQEGNGFKNGMHFSARRQNTRKN
jgi:hypothetical protein